MRCPTRYIILLLFALSLLLGILLSRYEITKKGKIITSVKTDYKNLLVLNQNYDTGWRVKGSMNNKVVNYQGLIATEVDKCTSKVEFYYSPISFIIGLFITFNTYGIFIFYFMLKKMFGVDMWHGSFKKYNKLLR